MSPSGMPSSDLRRVTLGSVGIVGVNASVLSRRCVQLSLRGDESWLTAGRLVVVKVDPTSRLADAVAGGSPRARDAIAAAVRNDQ